MTSARVAAVLGACLALWASVPSPSAAIDVVVPAGLVQVDGGGANAFPFGCGVLYDSQRYQQLYRGSEVGTGRITAIRFRVDAIHGAAFGPTILPGVVLTLSSTGVGMDALGQSFAANAGADERVVFSGDLLLESSSPPGPGTTRGFDVEIPLDEGFPFDASTGANLLLDVTVPSCQRTTFLDAEAAFGDGVCRLYSSGNGGANAPTGLTSTDGLVTQFVLAPASVGSPTPTPTPTPTSTPTCAPTGTPYCSDDCRPCPTIRPNCYAVACGACIQNPLACEDGLVRHCGGSPFPIAGCCNCVTPTPTMTPTLTPTSKQVVHIAVGSASGRPGDRKSVEITIATDGFPAERVELRMRFPGHLSNFSFTAAQNNQLTVGTAAGAWQVSAKSSAGIKNGLLYRVSFSIGAEAPPGTYPVIIEELAVFGSGPVPHPFVTSSNGSIAVADILRGDANGDDLVDERDLLALIHELFARQRVPEADVNADVLVGAADVTKLLRILI